MREGVDPLAALAPDLPTAVGVAAGKAYVILDGTLVRIDRVSVATGADRRYYSGKHQRHGSTCRSWPTRPGGCCGPHRATRPDPRPDRRPHPRPHRCHEPHQAAPCSPTAATKAPAGTVRVPFCGRGLPAGPHAVNCAHARIRAVGERAVATLKNWRVLRRICCCPHRGTALVTAILTLHLHAN